MTSRLHFLFAGLLVLLMAALLTLAPASAKPASGGYQLFEPTAPERQHAIQLASLGNFDDHAKITSECCNALNNGGHGSEWIWRSRVGGEFGVQSRSPVIDGPASLHETRLANELGNQGLDVRVRGTNVEGPDALIGDGSGVARYWDLKELTGEGRRRLQGSINQAKNNFTRAEAANLGLSRSDTRVIVDARDSPTWNDRSLIQRDLDRMQRSGDLDNVAEIKVLTTDGPVTWVRP